MTAPGATRCWAPARANEITRVARLLREFDLRGAVNAGDALLTQREIARHLVEDKEADSVRANPTGHRHAGSAPVESVFVHYCDDNHSWAKSWYGANHVLAPVTQAEHDAMLAVAGTQASNAVHPVSYVDSLSINA